MGKKNFRREAKGLCACFFGLFVFALIFFGIHVTWAAYPDRPVNMVVCYAPGSGGDFGSKIIGERISKYLGQPLISVYKPGGGGSLGAAFVAKAKPDGYTVLVGSTTPLVLATIFKKLDYKLEDFILLGTYSKGLQWLAVKKDARWKNLKELVDEAKKSPGKITAATFGKLSSSDIVLELLNKHAGIKLLSVPFKSSAEEISALLGGHVEVAFISSPGTHLDAGTIRILGIAERHRVEEIPDVPTFQDSGYPIYLSGAYSLCFPKATPPEIVNRFVEAQKSAIKKHGPEIKTELKKIEQFANFLTPEDSYKLFLDLRENVQKLARELGATPK